MPEITGGAAGAVDSSAGAIRRENLRLLVRSPAFLIGAAILLWWIVCALFGKTIAPYNPVAGSLTAFNDPPSGAHWFGTDSLGRDVLSRVIVGSRGILLVAALATLLGTVLGTTIGLVQGYFLGAVDSFIGRLVEAVLALPIVIVAFLFVVALGPSAPILIVVIGLVFGLLIARTVRTAVLQERGLDYIAAARLRDESNVHIMFVEILPNVIRAHPGRVHGPPRVRDLHDRDPVVPRLRHPAADARLGGRHRQQRPVPRGRVLVGDALPGAGDRLAGGRHQPHCRLHRGGGHPVTSDAPVLASPPTYRRAGGGRRAR